MDDENIEVFSASMRMLWFITATLIAMGIGIVALPFFDGEMQGDPTDSANVFGTLLDASLAWGGAGILGWLARRYSGSVVWIGPQGVFDRRTMTRAVDWEDVRRIEFVDIETNGVDVTVLGLEVANPGQIKKRTWGVLGDKLGKAIGMPPVSIQMTGLKPSEAAAMAAFSRHMPARLKRQAPELGA